MPIIEVIVILAVVGVLLWGVGQLPLDATIMKLIRVVVIVAVVLWLLDLFFGFGFSTLTIGRHR